MRLVLWGQSLGAGVALVAAAADLNPDPDPNLSSNPELETVDRGKPARENDSDRVGEGNDGQGKGEGEKGAKGRVEISGIILETPFVSVAAMLPALYPEKWLPYRYLAPFLTNHWDGEEALRKIGEAAGAGCPHGLGESFDQDDSSSSSSSSKTGTGTGTGTGKRPEILILQAGRDEVVPKEHAMKLETVCKEVGLQIRRVEVRGALHTEAIVKAGGKRAVVEFLREMAQN